MPRFEIRGEKAYYKSGHHLMESITVIDNFTNEVVESEYLFIKSHSGTTQPTLYMHLADCPSLKTHSVYKKAGKSSGPVIICRVHRTVPAQPEIAGHEPKELYQISETDHCTIITPEDAKERIEEEKPRSSVQAVDVSNHQTCRSIKHQAGRALTDDQYVEYMDNLED